MPRARQALPAHRVPRVGRVRALVFAGPLPPLPISRRIPLMVMRSWSPTQEICMSPTRLGSGMLSATSRVFKDHRESRGSRGRRGALAPKASKATLVRLGQWDRRDPRDLRAMRDQ